MANFTFSTINCNEKLIAPSLLAADFACLESDILETKRAGVKILHIDVMDGHFVPNISIGIPIVSSIRKVSDQLFDVHLMISHPLKYIAPFVKAGADNITFHIETEDNPLEVIAEIRKLNKTVGMTLKPGTKPEEILPYLDMIDMVLIMSVEPGFGGQSFMPDMMQKVEFFKTKAREMKNKNFHIEVDGGIDLNTIGMASKAGANIFVAGTSVFKNKNKIQASIISLLEEAKEDGIQ
ncbi:MAG TPA: ribulose-phosphate 3-epimerase [Lentisphaeria bacterium]|nr:MAG: ribulose-phosphate 3-epimerase [Lentisphaerae bacterium GWF2_38_69]HBM15311.1 ribulose-phosphate 3-epimerase [Lentisphaeria bacterium]